MTNLKKLTACGAALALVAVGSLAFAQDDLDDMLKDLEGEIGAEEATTAEAKAEEPKPAEEKAEEAAPAEAPKKRGRKPKSES